MKDLRTTIFKSTLLYALFACALASCNRDDDPYNGSTTSSTNSTGSTGNRTGTSGSTTGSTNDSTGTTMETTGGTMGTT